MPAALRFLEKIHADLVPSDWTEALLWSLGRRSEEQGFVRYEAAQGWDRAAETTFTEGGLKAVEQSWQTRR